MSTSSRLVFFALALGPLSSPAAAASIEVPSGTHITARLDRELRSEDAAPGDPFELTVAAPVYVARRLAIPAGSAIEGRVTVVKSAGRSGVMAVGFNRLRTPDGRVYDIDGTLAPTHEGAEVDIPSGKKAAVVIIGNEVDAPQKRASTLVGDSGEAAEDVAERWSKSGLSPSHARVARDTEVTIDLRAPVAIEAAFDAAP